MNKRNLSLLAIIQAIMLFAAPVVNAEPLKLPTLPNMPAVPTAPSVSATVATPDSNITPPSIPSAPPSLPADNKLTAPALPTTPPSVTQSTIAPVPALTPAPAPALTQAPAPVPAPNPTPTLPSTPPTTIAPASTLPTTPQPTQPINPAAIKAVVPPLLTPPVKPTITPKSGAADDHSNTSKPATDSTPSAVKIGKSMPAPYIDDNTIKIATGTIDGLYYPAGQALCRVINREKKDLNLWCDTELTNGSIDNLSALIQAYDNVALVQSDWQKKAFTGADDFKDQQKSFEDMRFLFSLYNEGLTIIVKKTSSIAHLDDIAHHSISMGPDGSGVRSIMQTIMDAKSWTNATFSTVSSISQSQQPEALCKGDIDVMIVAIGHPNDIVKKVSSLCEIRLLDIASDTDVQKILANHTEYAPVTIEGGIYPGVPQSVKTFGVTATVVTTSDMSDDNAYKFVKTIFTQLDYFKKLNPILGNLSAMEMITEGQIAPIHPGAAKYFKEAKYIP